MRIATLVRAVSYPLRFIVLVSVVVACRDRQPDSASTAAATTNEPQQAFWAALTGLCGNAYAGRVADSEPPDTVMSRAVLVMHVRQCSADTIRIPFHVGENRSRTWVLTRTSNGLRLKHDHRHEDGSTDSITFYGGDTRDAGTPEHQEFHADSLTASLIPAARSNVWTLEFLPGRKFAYALRREGATRRFRAEFDLASPVLEPAAPWGAGP